MRQPEREPAQMTAAEILQDLERINDYFIYHNNNMTKAQRVEVVRMAELIDELKQRRTKRGGVILLKGPRTTNGNTNKLSIDTTSQSYTRGAFISAYSDHELTTTAGNLRKAAEILQALGYTEK